MIQAIIFDLDDTLYDASQFYLGAFRDMTAYLQKRFKRDGEALLRSLSGSWRELTSRRSTYLDAFLRRESLPEEEKFRLLDIFWRHEMPLELYPDAQRLLDDPPQGMRTAIVSDGHGIMQRNKVRALGLVGRSDPIVFTSDFGPGWQKPSPLPIRAACYGLRLDPADILFVGDDPYLDAIGPHRLGMPAIRVRRGEFRDHQPQEANLFRAEISSLDQLRTDGFFDSVALKSCS